MDGSYYWSFQKKDFRLDLKFGRKKISKETFVKFVGLLVDSTLSWMARITGALKKKGFRLDLKFGRKKISKETFVKFVGLLVDSTLSWMARITGAFKKRVFGLI